MSESPKDFGGALDTRKVDFSAFANDITPSASSHPGVGGAALNSPIETLSITHLVGRGRTNTTIVRPTIVQTDAASPYATLDMTKVLDGQPGVGVHFEPDAYGIAETRDYVVSFYLDCSTECLFDVTQYGAYNPSGIGNRPITGRQVLTVALDVVPSAAQCTVSVTQIAGTAWNWYQTVIGPPPITVVGNRPS